MSKLTKLAMGKPCMIRLPAICNFNPETTVLCHYRLPGTCGTGIKPPDLLGAWGCSACHDEVDGRTHKLGSGAVSLVRYLFAEGVMRTQYALIKLEAIKS